ncbi:MAG: RluA family pseudouridine synthase, partial [Firmicutes bacterium]|nr:RluA family pseudouridine synthase [Bacillota bacterium]
MREIVIEQNDGGQRLDRFLRKYLPKAPLSYVYKLIRKDIKLNGKRAKEDSMLSEGDVLSIYAADQDLDAYTEKKRTRSAKRQFTVLFENDDLIIVSKPFGLLVHGDKTEKKDTLANQVTDYLIETGAYVPRLEKSFVP